MGQARLLNLAASHRHSAEHQIHKHLRFVVLCLVCSMEGRWCAFRIELACVYIAEPPGCSKVRPLLALPFRQVLTFP